MKLFIKALLMGMMINLVSVAAFAAENSVSCTASIGKLEKKLAQEVKTDDATKAVKSASGTAK